MSDRIELIEKQRRVNDYLDRGGYDAMLLASVGNFAWFTGGGDSHVGLVSETGVGALLVYRDRKTLITNNIERARLLEEELDGQGFGDHVNFWVDHDLASAVAEVAPRQRVVSDIGISGVTPAPSEIARLRFSLTPAEVERYRSLGADVGAAFADACAEVKPGMTEFDAAALLSGHQLARGITPIVLLVAADDRIPNYRHPIPTERKIERTVMLVAGGRRHGMICSATRMVSFGALTEELRQKHDAVVRVDATFIANTRTGTRVGDIFKAGLAAYEAHGFDDEWKLHHQGGPTGYVPREYRATIETESFVEPNQAFAWNPSITGTKSEDTIIATSDGPEILSTSPGFPAVEVRVEDKRFSRADILVR